MDGKAFPGMCFNEVLGSTQAFYSGFPFDFDFRLTMTSTGGFHPDKRFA